MISLLTFIQTGRLGEIGLGSTRTEVELTFGPPQSWGWSTKGNWLSRPKWRTATIEKKGHVSMYEAENWVYGGFCVSFEEETVDSIDIYFPNEIDCWGLSERSTLAEVKQRLLTSVASLDFGLDSVGKCLFCLHHLFFESTKSDVFGVKWPVLAPRVSFEALWGAPRRN